MKPIAELPFIAGDVALDFVNTAEERDHPEADDALRTPADLRLWGERYGLINSAPDADDVARAELRRARQARELLYVVFFERVQRRPVPRKLLSGLGQLASAAYRAASLEPTGDGSIRWQWDPSQLATIRHVAVTSAIELLEREPSPRLKQCPGEQCGWFFLDATKRGNRRWCSMSECGQEVKNLRRRKASAAHR